MSRVRKCITFAKEDFKQSPASVGIKTFLCTVVIEQPNTESMSELFQLHIVTGGIKPVAEESEVWLEFKYTTSVEEFRNEISEFASDETFQVEYDTRWNNLLDLEGMQDLEILNKLVLSAQEVQPFSFGPIGFSIRLEL